MTTTQTASHITSKPHWQGPSRPCFTAEWVKQRWQGVSAPTTASVSGEVLEASWQVHTAQGMHCPIENLPYGQAFRRAWLLYYAKATVHDNSTQVKTCMDCYLLSRKCCMSRRKLMQVDQQQCVICRQASCTGLSYSRRHARKSLDWYPTSFRLSSQPLSSANSARGWLAGLQSLFESFGWLHLPPFWWYFGGWAMGRWREGTEILRIYVRVQTSSSSPSNINKIRSPVAALLSQSVLRTPSRAFTA